LVTWDRVQRLLELGRLGIHDLELMECVLQLCWLWL
jgi:hypothetical protein